MLLLLLLQLQLLLLLLLLPSCGTPCHPVSLSVIICYPVLFYSLSSINPSDPLSLATVLCLKMTNTTNTATFMCAVLFSPLDHPSHPLLISPRSPHYHLPPSPHTSLPPSPSLYPTHPPTSGECRLLHQLCRLRVRQLSSNPRHHRHHAAVRSAGGAGSQRLGQRRRYLQHYTKLH
jgi:hypothetical protein